MSLIYKFLVLNLVIYGLINYVCYNPNIKRYYHPLSLWERMRESHITHSRHPLPFFLSFLFFFNINFFFYNFSLYVLHVYLFFPIYSSLIFHSIQNIICKKVFYIIKQYVLSLLSIFIFIAFIQKLSFNYFLPFLVTKINTNYKSSKQ
jgi:hypothetical protein